LRTIDLIVIHCADTPSSMDIGVKEIREWHTAPLPKGRGWKDIGYHWVIRRNGEIEQGRTEETQGAHVAGHNEHSIGICLVGGKPTANFTVAQMVALKGLLHEVTTRYPKATVLGHYNLDPHKTCPNFDAAQFWLTELEHAALTLPK
jgi:hypothetical protein